jgi:hypothetical protein
VEETNIVNRPLYGDRTFKDPDEFLIKAKRAVEFAEYTNVNEAERASIENGEGFITVEDLYIVWFAKVLGNWKALISTDKVSGAYWEVTYNGNKNETYVDLYGKVHNTVVPD